MRRVLAPVSYQIAAGGGTMTRPQVLILGGKTWGPGDLSGARARRSGLGFTPDLSGSIPGGSTKAILINITH